MDYRTINQGVLCCYFNSLSNMYAGSRYEANGRYPKEIEEKYTSLKFVFPYKNPVYYTMTIDDEGIEVKGTSSRFVPPNPEAFGNFNRQITPCASSFKYTWAELEKMVK